MLQCYAELLLQLLASPDDEAIDLRVACPGIEIDRLTPCLGQHGIPVLRIRVGGLRGAIQQEQQAQQQDWHFHGWVAAVLQPAVADAVASAPERASTP